MPFVIPVVAAFASGAVASVIAGTATLSAYLTVAGAALSTIGALTKNEDISKFGAILSIGSGLAGGFAGGASSGAEAVSGMDVAADAGMGAMDAGGAALSGAGGVAGANAVGPTADEMAGLGDGVQGPTAEEMAGLGADTASGSGQQMLNDALTGSGNAAEQAGSFNDPSQSFGLMDATQGGGYAQPTSLMDTMPQAQQAPNTIMSSGGAQPQAVTSAVKPVIQQGGQALDQGSLGKWLTSAGKWAEQNKTMLNMMGQVAHGMYGPQAQANNFQQSLWDTRRKNMNSPIALGPTTKG